MRPKRDAKCRSLECASPAECQLVEYVLAGGSLDELPARLIAGNAYDSDPLDRTLRSEYAIEMSLPTGATAAGVKTP